MTDIKPEWTNSPERLKELRDWEVKTELATENELNDDHLNHSQSGTYFISALRVLWLKRKWTLLPKYFVFSESAKIKHQNIYKVEFLVKRYPFFCLRTWHNVVRIALSTTDDIVK